MSKKDDVVSRMMTAAKVRTATELAEYIGIDQSAISQWRRRGSVPEGPVAKVAAMTRVNLDWLLTGQGDMRPDKVGESAEGYKTEPEEIWQAKGEPPSECEMEVLDMMRSLDPKVRRRVTFLIRGHYDDKIEETKTQE